MGCDRCQSNLFFTMLLSQVSEFYKSRLSLDDFQCSPWSLTSKFTCLPISLVHLCREIGKCWAPLFSQLVFLPQQKDFKQALQVQIILLIDYLVSRVVPELESNKEKEKPNVGKKSW